ncbi:MAG TPA: hypothetical protein ENH87_11195 [Pricia antarctica]|uniref:Uncharacterized protein n=1 Tax=Pricia antarctica TaxID=641691 RepID=A0A831QQW0_9FLAO|nr:hypothetical protein [Pricia antarctica]
MKLEDQVCSLESAKKLKELGVKQDSLWGYLDHGDLDFSPVLNRELIYIKAQYSAFTVAELGEIINKSSTRKTSWFTIYDARKMRKDQAWESHELEWGGGCVDFCEPDKVCGSLGDENTEAEARATTLIYLLENKLIKEK